MHQSETFGFTIARPLTEVYEFLLEPTNFAKWAFVGDNRMRHLGGRDWAVETSVGPRIIRFAERNPFGILDHYILRQQGDLPHPTALRTVANGVGTELIYTNFKRADWSNVEWASAKDWVVADLLGLQSMLDARGPVSPVLPSRTVAYSIERPVAEVYEFLAAPRNFAEWVFAGDARMEPLSNGEWAVETSVGPRVMRFSQRNGDGVLDYTSRLEAGGPPLAIPMRVFPNVEGTELTFTFLQRPRTSEAEWQSLIEWVSADLVALKSVLEAKR